jgi:uncharacterized Tic20 family protein
VSPSTPPHHPNPNSSDPHALPGWYPVDASTQRYWDGTAWTEHTAPLGGSSGVTNDERNFAVLIHILSIVSSFLAPLILWLIKRDESPFVDHHGKEALNFQITMFIAWSVTIVLVFVLIGLLLIPVLLVIQIVFPIMAGLAANRDEYYRYPLTLRLIS